MADNNNINDKEAIQEEIRRLRENIAAMEAKIAKQKEANAVATIPQAEPVVEPIPQAEPVVEQIPQALSSGQVTGGEIPFAPAPEQLKPKKKLYKKWWFWLIVLLVIGGIGGAFGSSGDKNKEEPVQTSNKQEEVEEPQEDNENDKTQEAQEKEEAEEVVEDNDQTVGMDIATKNAYRSAKDYLAFSGFSKQGLIDQLSSEYGDGYTVEQATAAVQAMEDAGEVDWNEQAVRSGQDYLDMQGFSRSGLIEQLSSEYGDKFTVDQATYAADQLGL